MPGSLPLSTRLAVATRVVLYSVPALLVAVLGCGVVLVAAFLSSRPWIQGKFLFTTSLALLPISVALASATAMRPMARVRAEIEQILPRVTVAAVAAVCALIVIAAPRPAFPLAVDLVTFLGGIVPVLWIGAFAGTYAPAGFGRSALSTIKLLVTGMILIASYRQPSLRASHGQLSREAFAAQPARLPAPQLQWRRSGADADVLAVAPSGHVFRRIKGGLAADRWGGTAAWTYEIDPTAEGVSDAIVHRDGTLFAIHERRLYAIGADGARRWESDLPPDVAAPRLLSTDREGAVYVGVQLGPSSQVMVFAADGKLRSTTLLPEPVLTGAAALSDGVVVTAGQRVLQLARDGAVISQHKFASTVGRPVAAGRCFYVTEARTLWVVKPDAAPAVFFRAESADWGGDAPLVGAGVIYWMPGRLYAIGADGRPRWSWGEPGEVDGVPVLVRDGVAFTTRDRQVVALSHEGEKLWTYADMPRPFSRRAKLFAGDTFFYVHYLDDRFLAFDAPDSLTAARALGALRPTPARNSNKLPHAAGDPHCNST